MQIPVTKDLKELEKERVERLTLVQNHMARLSAQGRTSVWRLPDQVNTWLVTCHESQFELFSMPDEDGNVITFHSLNPAAGDSEDFGKLVQAFRLQSLPPARQLPETFATFQELHDTLLEEIWVGGWVL